MFGKSSNNSNGKAVSQNYLEGSRSGRIAERERKNGEMLFSRSFYWNLVKEKLMEVFRGVRVTIVGGDCLGCLMQLPLPNPLPSIFWKPRSATVLAVVNLHYTACPSIYYESIKCKAKSVDVSVELVENCQ